MPLFIPFMSPLASGVLLTLAGAGTSSACFPPKAAEIKVVPSTREVMIDKSASRERMLARNGNIDTINPYGYENATQVNGLMSGTIGMRHVTKLGHKSIPESGGLCLWYETVEIRIEIDPKIEIAAEIAKDRCMYKATLEHEMKHVKADRQIVNKYAQTMGRKVYDGLARRGFFIGPVSPDHAPEAARRMQETVGQLLDLEYRKMEVERQEIQQGIDSLEEYNRVAVLCPDYKPAPPRKPER